MIGGKKIRTEIQVLVVHFNLVLIKYSLKYEKKERIIIQKLVKYLQSKLKQRTISVDFYL